MRSVWTFEPNIERQLFAKKVDATSYYIDRDGKKRFGPFENALPFRDGCAAVQHEGAWWSLATNGKLVRLGGWKYLTALGAKRFFVRKEPGVNRGAIVDDEGRVVVEGLTIAKEYAGGVAPFARDGIHDKLASMDTYTIGEWGLLRGDGTEAMAPRWTGIEAPREGHVLVCEGGRPNPWNVVGGRYRFVDVDGKPTIAGDFEAAASFGDGIAPVRANGWRVIDARGTTVSEPGELDGIAVFDRGAAVATFGKGHTTWYRLMLRDGTFVTSECAWLAWREGVALGMTGKRVQGEHRPKAGIVYRDGSTRPLDIVASWVSDGFCDGIASMLEGNRALFVTPDGTRLFEPFAAGGPFSDGFAPVRDAPAKKRKPAAKKPAAKKPKNVKRRA